MRDVQNQTFNSVDDVPLDGASFVNCSFNGCTLHYNGSTVKLKNCDFHGCNLVLGSTLGMAIEVLRAVGFDLVAVGTSGNSVVN